VHLRALIFFRVRLRALTSFFSVPPSPHLFLSAPLSPHFLRVRLRALDQSFEYAFEPSPPSSAPSSPRSSFRVRLRALTFFLSAPSSPHLFF
jgi:hypothetical protein